MSENYCNDARKLFNIQILCGKDCPLYDNCPYNVVDDIGTKAAKKIMKGMIKLAKK